MPYSPRTTTEFESTHTKSLTNQTYEYQHHGTDYDATMNVVDDYEYHPTEDYDAIVRKSKKSSSRREYENNDSSYSPALSYSSISSGRSSNGGGRRKDVLEELSEEDMRRKMYKKYKDKGVIGLLKTQLRSVIYDDLTKKAPIKEPNVSVFGTRSEIQRACDGIVLDHLKKNGYSFTTSIFTSEANIREVPKNSEYDVYHLIGVKIYNLDVVKDTDSHDLLDYDPNNQLTKLLSEMYYSTSWKGESILTKFLSIIKKLGEKKTRIGMCQTDSLTEEQPVDSKLKMIDEEFITKLENEKKYQTQTLEQKYLEYQRECEKRANEELKSRLKMFEETTISTMRLEESAKYRERIAREIEEMEKAHMRKMDRLMEREREISARLEKKEKDLEKHLFEHRQKMYKEVEDLQRRNQALARDKNTLEMRKAELEDKARRLDVLAAQTTVDVKSEMSLMRANLERENIANMRRIEEERRKLELEKEQVAEIMKKHSEAVHLEETIKQYQGSLDIVKSELNESRKRIRDLEEMNDQLRMQLGMIKDQTEQQQQSSNSNEKSITPAIIHIPSIDVARENSLNREIENLKLQLRDKERELCDLQDRIVIYERNERNLRSTIEDNEREKKRLVDDCKKELIEEKQKTKKALIHWQSTERATLAEKLQKDKIRTERMQRDLEEQYLQNRTLQHEIDRLRNLLELPRVSGGQLQNTNYSDIGTKVIMPEISYPSSLRDENLYAKLSDYPEICVHDKLNEIDKLGFSFSKDFADLKDTKQRSPPSVQSTKQPTNDFLESLGFGSLSNSYMMEDTKPSSYSTYGLSTNQMNYSDNIFNNTTSRGESNDIPINNHRIIGIPPKSSSMAALHSDNPQTTSNIPTTSDIYTQSPKSQTLTTSPPKKNYEEPTANFLKYVSSPKKHLYNDDTNPSNKIVSSIGDTISTQRSQPIQQQTSFIPSTVIGSTSPPITSIGNNSPSIDDSKPSTFSQTNSDTVQTPQTIEPEKRVMENEAIYQKPPSPKQQIHEQQPTTFVEQPPLTNNSAAIVEEVKEERKESPEPIEEETTVENQDGSEQKQPSSVEEYKRMLQQQRELDSRASTVSTLTSNHHESENRVDEQFTEEHYDEQVHIHDDHHSEGWNISDASISGGGFDDDDLDVEDDLFGQKDYDDF